MRLFPGITTTEGVHYIPVIYLSVSKHQRFVIQMRRLCSATNDHRHRLNPYLITQSGIDEALQCLGSAFHHQRLHTLFIKPFGNLRRHVIAVAEVKSVKTRVLFVNNQTHRILAMPQSYIQLWLVPFCRDPSHEYCVVLASQFMNKHLRIRSRHSQRFISIIEIPVCRLTPFQQDIRTLKSIEGEETLIESFALLLKNPHLNINTGIFQFSYSVAVHFCKGVYASHNSPFHTFLYYKVSTWRCLAIVGAGFKTYIYRSLRQEMFVLRLHRCEGVHLGMSFTATHMVAFADYSVSRYYNSPHHRVGFGVLSTTTRKLQTAFHVFLVLGHGIYFYWESWENRELRENRQETLIYLKKDRHLFLFAKHLSLV